MASLLLLQCEDCVLTTKCIILHCLNLLCCYKLLPYLPSAGGTYCTCDCWKY